MKNTLKFLEYTKIISKKSLDQLLNKHNIEYQKKKYILNKKIKHLLFTNKIFAKTEKFSWITKPQNFKYFSKGYCIAKDDKKKINNTIDPHTKNRYSYP